MNTSNYIRRLNSAHDFAARERKSQIQLNSKKIRIESRSDRSLDTIEQIKIEEKTRCGNEDPISGAQYLVQFQI